MIIIHETENWYRGYPVGLWHFSSTYKRSGGIENFLSWRGGEVPPRCFLLLWLSSFFLYIGRKFAFYASLRYGVVSVNAGIGLERSSIATD